MHTAICTNCGTSFDVANRRAGKAKFCSLRCRRGANLAERFWRKVAIHGPDECWPWQGAVNAGGYGQIRIAGRASMAPRVAYELTNGPIPAGRYVCHSCDNPPCCNPKHLWAGTPTDNYRDMSAKGRYRKVHSGGPSPGEKHPWHKLTAREVLAIRVTLGRGGVSQTQLAEAYGVHQSTLSRILSRDRWKHLP